MKTAAEGDSKATGVATTGLDRATAVLQNIAIALRAFSAATATFAIAADELAKAARETKPSKS
jgi:hypothetical protein